MEMEIADNCLKTECRFLDGCREGYCFLSIFSCLLSLSRLPSLGEAIEDLNGFYRKIKHSEVVCGLLLDMDLVVSPLAFTSCNLLLFFPSSNKGRLLASGSACNCNCELEVQIFLVCNLHSILRYDLLFGWVFLLSKRSMGIFVQCCISSWSCWI
ncbi:hypothetical protein BDL97_05G012600 [Sphagnum fallax]|nr:hypothetical protein BDL97_05G012600 [Sphagnum fallax]